MANAVECPEHVWELRELVSGDDGRLHQRFSCQRCPAQQLVGPDDVPPGSPDLPV